MQIVIKLHLPVNKMDKHIGIIGVGDTGHSLAVEMELMKLRDRGVNFVMVDDLCREKENNMVDDFIRQMTSLPINEILPFIPEGQFTEEQTKKAIAKKKWKDMTYKERKQPNRK